jgi:hypothetical protein
MIDSSARKTLNQTVGSGVVATVRVPALAILTVARWLCAGRYHCALSVRVSACAELKALRDV